MRRVYTLFLALVALACLVLVGLRSARAQSAGWSEPFELSDTARFSWFPDMAVGPDGSVHVVWASGDPDPKNPRDGTKAIDLLRYRELRGGAWSATNDILFTGLGGYTVRNSLVAGRDGLLHLVVRMHTRIFASSAPEADAWSARAWSQPQPLTGDIAYYTALAVDSRNGLHALWSEAVQPADDPICPGCSDLFYRRSSDGGLTWSAPQNLSYSQEGENRPQIVIDARDRIHAVWDQGVDWYAGAGKPLAGVYRRSDDGGQTWSDAVHFTAGDAPVQQTALAVDGQGNPLVVFRDAASNRIYFQSSSDGGTTWGALGEVPGVLARDINDNNLDRYALAADSANRVHLLLSGFPTGRSSEGSNPWLLHLVWDGARWSAPQVVMGNELYPEWPRLVVAGGNQLHAVWFTRHADDLFGSDQGAHYQIWYSTLPLDTPAIAPAPVFTPVPTAAPPTPTAAPLRPTSVPLSEAARETPPPGGQPAWELQGVQLIGLALLPVAAIFGLLGAVLWWRRR